MTTQYRNPAPTVDIIIEIDNPSTPGRKGIVLINRKNPPSGWAIPGGFVDYGESMERAAAREALEETSLEVEIIRQFHTYSDPSRDPRQHTISTVYIARAAGVPKGRDDALEAKIFDPERIPSNMAFDHADIIKDYLDKRY